MNRTDTVGTVGDPQKVDEAREYIWRAADYMLDGNLAATLASVIVAVDKLADAAQQLTDAASQLDRLLWVLQSRELLTVAERNWITEHLSSQVTDP